jgi:hypothetical protein
VHVFTCVIGYRSPACSTCGPAWPTHLTQASRASSKRLRRSAAPP